GGAPWSAETKVNDDTVHAWQFFPAISVSPNGTVALSFYDTRNDSTGKKTDQYISFSTDGGVTWSANQRVTTAQSDESGADDPSQTEVHNRVAAGGEPHRSAEDLPELAGSAGGHDEAGSAAVTVAHCPGEVDLQPVAGRGRGVSVQDRRPQPVEHVGVQSAVSVIVGDGNAT